MPPARRHGVGQNRAVDDAAVDEDVPPGGEVVDLDTAAWEPWNPESVSERLAALLRLEQQHDLGCEERHTGRRALHDVGVRTPDRRVAPADPDVAVVGLAGRWRSGTGTAPFPGCHLDITRTHAHHVTEWEDGGATDLSNTVLLCVKHHHAVHEGGWTITSTAGIGPHTTGCWTFTPPRTRP